MKKITAMIHMWIILYFIFIINVTGCSSERIDVVSETSSVSENFITEIGDETESISTRMSAEKNEIEDKNILEVLQNKKKYYNTEFGEYRYLKDYSSSNSMNDNEAGKYTYYEDSSSEDLKIDYWCEVDMDSDGNKEVILQTDYGNVLVLHSNDDTVYCYAFSFRGMNSIKTDGSFAKSGSAANTYIGKLKFVDGECFYDEICAIDELDANKLIYRINKKDTSRKKVISFLKKQEKKEQVLWIKGNPMEK